MSDAVRVAARRSGDDRAAVAPGAPQRGRRSDRGRARRRVSRVRRRSRRERRGAARRGRRVLRRRRPEGGRHAERATGWRRDGDGPMGPTRMRLSQAGDRRDRRARGGRRARAGAVVRPAGCRGGRRARRVLPALGRAADRRRDRPAAAPDRGQPGDGHGPDRPRRWAPRRRWRWAWSTGWCRRARAVAAAEELARELARVPADVHARGPAVAARAGRARGGTRRSPTSCDHGMRSLAGGAGRGWSGSAPARAVTASFD